MQHQCDHEGCGREARIYAGIVPHYGLRLCPDHLAVFLEDRDRRRRTRIPRPPAEPLWLVELRHEWSDVLRHERYQEYLRGKHWQATRAAVLDRCAGWCQVCHSARATEVHHRTYCHPGAERPWELQGVCSRCHDRLHGREI